MRLFRQRTPLVWDDAIARASTELALLAGEKRELAGSASDVR
jgi:hypothetical protein